MAFGDFTVARTSVKRVLNASGVLASVAANTPAFEFNADGSYKGLLIEPALTNLLAYSEDITDAFWTKYNLTATYDSGTGFATLTDSVDVSPISHAFFREAGLFSATDTDIYREIYVKNPNNLRYVSLYSTGSVVNVNALSISATFDLQDVTVTEQSGVVGFIQQVGIGTYRIGIFRALAVSSTASRRWSFCFSDSPTPDATTNEYQGSGNRSCEVSFAHIGINQTVSQSPIKTTGSTVTRTADSVTLTGASSLIGQTEGALALGFRAFNAGTSRVLATLFEDSSNFIRLRLTTTNTLIAEVTQGGSAQASIESSALTTNTRYGAVLSYANNSVFLSLDGAQVGATDTSATIPTCSKCNIGSDNAGANIANANIAPVVNYPTALSLANANALSLQLKTI